MSVSSVHDGSSGMEECRPRGRGAVKPHSSSCSAGAAVSERCRAGRFSGRSLQQTPTLSPLPGLPRISPGLLLLSRRSPPQGEEVTAPPRVPPRGLNGLFPTPRRGHGVDSRVEPLLRQVKRGRSLPRVLPRSIADHRGTARPGVSRRDVRSPECGNTKPSRVLSVGQSDGWTDRRTAVFKKINKWRKNNELK